MIFIDMTGIKCFLKLERNMYSFDVSLCKIDEFWVCSRGKSSIGVCNQNCQSEQNQSCLHKALFENTRHLEEKPCEKRQVQNLSTVEKVEIGC